MEVIVIKSSDYESESKAAYSIKYTYIAIVCFSKSVLLLYNRESVGDENIDYKILGRRQA